MKQKRVYVTKWLPLGRSYYAICLFGFVFSRKPLSPVELNHERIHAAQQKELLYVLFFLWYGVEWLFNLIKYRNTLQAYYHIRFEQEAYRHQNDLNYLSHRRSYHFLSDTSMT